MKKMQQLLKKEKKKIGRIVLRNIIILAVIAGVYTVFNLLTKHGCPIRWLFHIPCPFCGMTRAHLAALRLDFAAAFAYHPLFLLGIPYVLLLIGEDLFSGKGKRIYNIVVAVLTVMFLVRYVISLFI